MAKMSGVSEPEKTTAQSQSFNSFSEYCNSLAKWVEQQTSAVMMAQQHAVLSRSMQSCAGAYARQHFATQVTQTSPNGTSASSGQRPESLRVQQGAQQSAVAAARVPQQQDPNMPIQGRRYVIPNPWKRIAAELIDYMLLLLVKIVFALIINRDLSFRQIAENIDLDLRYLSQRSAAVSAAGTLRGMRGGQGGQDISPLELVTPEILIAELVNRVFITFFETVCLYRGIRGELGGATPGKRLMGLRVVACQDVFDFPARVEVVPGNNPGFLSALIRSVIKNFAMVFFFPICLTTLFFQHHRATYDIIAGTVVVQVEPAQPG